MLPSFNKEKLLQEIADEDPEKSSEVADNLDQDAIKANVVAEGNSNADVSPDL